MLVRYAAGDLARSMYDHAYYRDGIPQWVKNPEHRQIGLRAVDAYFLSLKDADRLDARQLEYVLDAMRCPAKSVWVSASDFLKRLAGRHPEVPAALEEIGKAGKANERQQLVMSLWQSTSRRYFPRPVLLKFFTFFVNDANAKVRLFGVQGADSHCLQELLPRVRSMAAEDPDPKTRRSAEFHLPRLAKCFYTYWYETPLGCYLYIVRSPEGEKWILVRPGDVKEYMNPDLAAAELLATHRERTTIAWDYRNCAPAKSTNGEPAAT